MTWWCVEKPDGTLMEGTLAETKGECLDILFEYMVHDFRDRFWKNRKGSQAGYRKLGYKAVKVKIVKL